MVSGWDDGKILQRLSRRAAHACDSEKTTETSHTWWCGGLAGIHQHGFLEEAFQSKRLLPRLPKKDRCSKTDLTRSFLPPLSEQEEKSRSHFDLLMTPFLSHR